MDTRTYYEDRYASAWSGVEYDSRFTKMWYKAFLRHVLPALTLPEHPQAVEVGAGKGWLAPFLAQRGIDYTATDIAESALAQVPVGPLCHTVRTEGEHLPFSDRCFDLVLCMEVLEHVVSPESTVAECFRVARLGASVVFSCPNYLNGFLPIKLLADLGVSVCRRYLVSQVVDRRLMPWHPLRWIAPHGTIIHRRAVRLAPPLFEKLEGRISAVNNVIFGIESTCGHRSPLNRLGLHTLVVARRR